jgi:Leucine-rich repeat (LRR) protein
LPESLGQLTQLRTLHLSNNHVTALPETLGQITKLKRLRLGGNQLTALPKSLGQLSLLEELHLSYNQLIALPESLCRLTSLRQLYLHGNDALGLPTELLGPTWEDVRDHNANPAKPAEILDYYFRTRGGSRPLNEAKLILVGRGGVGKTCIVNRLVYDRF